MITKQKSSPGSTLAKCAHLDDEVTTRLSKAISAFGRLRDNEWDKRGISTKTNINVRIPDTEVLERAEVEIIYALVKRSQLRWAGPRKLLYGEPVQGERSHGGQRSATTLKDCKLEETAFDCSA